MAEVAAAAASEPAAPLRGGGEPGRRVRRRREGARTVARRLRAAVHGEPAPDVPGHPGRAAAPGRGRRRVDRVRVEPGGGAAVPGRVGLHRVEGGGHRVRAGGRRRVPRRAGTVQRRATERHRHARPTGPPCRTPTTPLGAPGQIASTIRFLAGAESAADQRRDRSPSTGGPDGRTRAAERLDLVEDLHGHRVADPYRWLEDADDPRTKEWSAAQDELFAGHLAELAPARERFRAHARRARARRHRHARRCGAASAGSCAGASRTRSTRCCWWSRPTAPSASWSTRSRSTRPAPPRSTSGSPRSRATGSRTASPPAAPRSPTLYVLDVATGELLDGPDRPGPAHLGRLAARRRGVLLPAARAGRRGHPPPPGLPAPGRHRPGRRHARVRRGRRAGHLLRRQHQPRRPLAGGLRVAGHRPAQRPVARRPQPRRAHVRPRVQGRSATPARTPACATAACTSGPTSTRRADACAPPTRRTRRPGPRSSRRTPRRCCLVRDPRREHGLSPRGDDGLIAVDWMRHAVSEVTVHDLATGALVGPVGLPGVGTVDDLRSRPEGGDDLWLAFQTFDATQHVLHWRPGAERRAVLDGGRAGADAAGRSGAAGRVRVGATARRCACSCCTADSPYDGPRPTILYGYGGFNISMAPRYWPLALAWVAAGGVFAVANLRGGSEEGEDWHRAGMLADKQNVFDDFHAAADWLVVVGRGVGGRLLRRLERRAAGGRRAHPAARPVRRGRLLGAAARHGALRGVRARAELVGRVRHGGRPRAAGLAARRTRRTTGSSTAPTTRRRCSWCSRATRASTRCTPAR